LALKGLSNVFIETNLVDRSRIKISDWFNTPWKVKLCGEFDDGIIIFILR